MPNRLSSSNSPYLLQHADNPVDWYEWGEDAFGEARRRDVPILLSVGYSACHWCHVMAHESFEDEATAAYLNEHFVNVKVDREERPDVDRIYMDAVQAMTGRGGWPMTVFLDHDARPFFAGTYFPKDDRPGHPSFRRVLEGVEHAWRHQREDLHQQAARLTEAVAASIPAVDVVPGREVLEQAAAAIVASFDPQHGGFGGAPKFPQAPTLEFLLRLIALDGIDERATERRIVQVTLDEMSRGGIYDHVGGGFARYSVDRRWLVPHFEKMLYDNALLASTYLHGWQLTGIERFRRITEETLDYLDTEMVDEGGALHAAEDADSEGVEGKYSTWTIAELREALGDDAEVAATLFGATAEGNFEGTNVLHQPVDDTAMAQRLGVDAAGLEATRRRLVARLRTARNRRVRPGRDDKVITSWNGLALRAFAEAGAVLGRDDYLARAEAIADYLLDRHLPDDRLLRATRRGSGRIPAFCDDYAALAVGLFALFGATGEPQRFHAAVRLTDDMLRLFADPEGGFFATGSDAERLITRPKNLMDNPVPSDNSLAAEALVLRSAYTGEPDLPARIEATIATAGRLLERYPSAVGHMLGVLAVHTTGVTQVAIVGDPARRAPLEAVVRQQFRPATVLATAAAASAEVPLLAGRDPLDGPTAYVCHDFACDLPTSDPARLADQLAGVR